MRHYPAYGLVLALCLLPAAARGQQAVDVQVGRWAVPGPDPTHYSATLWRHLWGPFGYSLRGQALVDRDSLGRSLYGLGPEITLLRGSNGGAGLSAYGVGGVGLAWRAGASAGPAALWDAGIGLAYRARSLFSVGLELRRTAEDSDFRGFWDLGASDRRGWRLSVGFSVRWGGASGSRGAPPPISPAGHGGEASSGATPGTPADAERLELASRIVETALAAMGEPYRWGGTSSEEGFDCSGLVWYAYTAHGVQLPRVSRDQARAGRAIPASVAALRPGDILLFSNGGRAVTHVGLYVGDARFIHSTTSGGVRVGALDARADENDRWWLARWVGARRVLD